MHRRDSPVRRIADGNLRTVTALWLGTGLETISYSFSGRPTRMVSGVITFFDHFTSPLENSIYLLLQPASAFPRGGGLPGLTLPYCACWPLRMIRVRPTPGPPRPTFVAISLPSREGIAARPSKTGCGTFLRTFLLSVM
jgi:hypothetical protein